MTSWILSEPAPVPHALARLTGLQTSIERLCRDAPDLIDAPRSLETRLCRDHRFPGYANGTSSPLVDVLMLAELHACQADYFITDVAPRKIAYKTEIRRYLGDVIKIYIDLKRTIYPPSCQPYVFFTRDWPESLRRLSPS